MIPKRILTALYLCFATLSAQATVISTWDVDSGSSFFDASSGTTTALTGTLTTELLALSLDWRQNITDIEIAGAGITFSEASFGGGAIDIRYTTEEIVQVQVIVQSGSRFTTAVSSYTGAPDLPDTIALVDMYPFIIQSSAYDAADRMTLMLTRSVPAPASIGLLLVGLVGERLCRVKLGSE